MKTRTKLSYLPLLLLFVLLSASLAWHWNDRLLNSQMFRQTHTAQNAEMYKLVGWNPLRSYYRFLHKPGINVLELPVYQSLNAGLSQLGAFTIDQAGKLLNVICGLLFALGAIKLQRRLAPRGSHAREAELQAFALVFSSPLLFGISQWVLADLLACTLAIWGIILFEAAGRRSPNSSSRSTAALHTVVLFFSFAIKPTTAVATAPIYALLLWNGKQISLKPRLRVASAIAAILGGLIWFWYGQRLNQSLGAEFKITDSGYYLGSYALSPVWLGKLAARLLLYVVGPGTLFALVWTFTRKRFMSPVQLMEQPMALACAASFAMYTLVFLNLNVRHNYYQLPLLISVSLLLTSVSKQAARAITTWPIVVSIAIIFNFAVSEVQLLRIDQDLNTTIERLSQHIAPGITRPELTVVTSVNAVDPVLAYYLERYISEMPLEKVQPGMLRARLWFATCDQSIDDVCRKRILALAPACAERGFFRGRYWACVPWDEL